MSDDRVPPLPDDDDPFVLLGVGHDVDERELKRAYARRIRQYRPDREPAAFGRIQAAYEQARFALQLRAHLERAKAGAEGREARGEDVDDDWIEDGEDGEGNEGNEGDAPTTPAPRGSEPAVVPITGGGGPKAVAAAVAELQRLLDEGRFAEAVAMVDDDELAERAHDHVGLALVTLRALALGAWCSPRARTALRRYEQLALNGWLASAFARTEVEVAGAAALDGQDLPAPFLHYLRDRDRVKGEERAELTRALARSLADEPLLYLARFDALAGRRPGSLADVAALLAVELPARADQLPAPVAAALDRRLRGWHPSTLPRVLTVVTALLLWLSGRADLPTTVPCAVAFLGCLGWLWWTEERKEGEYGPAPRRALAGLVVELAVPSTCLVDWWQRNPTVSSPYRPFAADVDDDASLAVLALTAMNVRGERPCWIAAEAEAEADAAARGDDLA